MPASLPSNLITSGAGCVGSNLSFEARRSRLVQPHMGQMQRSTADAVLYAEAD